MNLNCEIVQDLLPLYADDVCSAESRAAVEEHLQSCESCRKQYARMTPQVKEPPLPPSSEDSRRFRKGMRKVRRRWFASLAAVLLLIPVLLLSFHQYRGEGICFTNLSDVWRGYRFLSLLRDGNYDSAFDLLDSKTAWNERTDFAYSGCIDPTDYSPLTIDGQIWYCADWTRYMQTVPDTLSGAPAEDFWQTLVQHSQFGIVLISSDAYRMLLRTGQLPSGEEEVPEEISRKSVSDPSGAEYELLCFPGSNCTADEYDLFSFSWDLPIVPESLWQQMCAATEQNRTEFEKRASCYLEMGYDAWLCASKEQFVASMQQFSSFYGSISRIRFRGTWRHSDSAAPCWQLEYDLCFSGSSDCRGGVTIFSGSRLNPSGGYERLSQRDNVLNAFLDIISYPWYTPYD